MDQLGVILRDPVWPFVGVAGTAVVGGVRWWLKQRRRRRQTAVSDTRSPEIRRLDRFITAGLIVFCLVSASSAASWFVWPKTMQGLIAVVNNTVVLGALVFLLVLVCVVWR